MHQLTMQSGSFTPTVMGKGVIMAKDDLKSSFRMFLVCPVDWDLLGIFRKGSYYVDTCLPFGLRLAPCL